MRCTITMNNKRVAYFESFRNSRGIYDILREYACYAEPLRCSTLFFEGQKIVTCYYPRKCHSKHGSLEVEICFLGGCKRQEHKCEGSHGKGKDRAGGALMVDSIYMIEIALLLLIICVAVLCWQITKLLCTLNDLYKQEELRYRIRTGNMLDYNRKVKPVRKWR